MTLELNKSNMHIHTYNLPQLRVINLIKPTEIISEFITLLCSIFVVPAYLSVQLDYSKILR